MGKDAVAKSLCERTERGRESERERGRERDRCRSTVLEAAGVLPTLCSSRKNRQSRSQRACLSPRLALIRFSEIGHPKSKGGRSGARPELVMRQARGHGTLDGRKSRAPVQGRVPHFAENQSSRPDKWTHRRARFHLAAHTHSDCHVTAEHDQETRQSSKRSVSTARSASSGM